MGSSGEGREGKVGLPKGGGEERGKRGVERDRIRGIKPSDKEWPISSFFLSYQVIGEG